MVSSTGAGFSSFFSSMRSEPFRRAAALAAPSRRRCVRVRRLRGRRAGRVSSFELLVSCWVPSTGSRLAWRGRGWVPASAGTTIWLGSARTGLAAVLRAPPRPWVPAFAGTTVVLGSVRAGLAAVLRPPPPPWVPASAGTTIWRGSVRAGLAAVFTAPAVPLGSRLRGNDDLAGLGTSGVGWGVAAPAPLDSGLRRNDG